MPEYFLTTQIYLKIQLEHFTNKNNRVITQGIAKNVLVNTYLLTVVFKFEQVH